MNLKILTFLSLLAIILILLVYGYFKAIPGVDNQARTAPKIAVSPASFDFGKTEYGNKLEYTFKVKNAGKEVLEIKKVTTSCACTSAQINQERINPNEETELKVTYDTGKMSGSHAKGSQERIIFIKSNDPVNPQTEVLIKADVK